jgi:ADP-ribosylglycohydrolase
MIGAIAGDIIGSIYEWERIKTKQFDLFSPDCFFTDDTVLTVALAESILTENDYGSLMRAYYRRYPKAGYGGLFHLWARAHENQPYNSWGNGAAMRISSVGFAFPTLDEARLEGLRLNTSVNSHLAAYKTEHLISIRMAMFATAMPRMKKQSKYRYRTAGELLVR